MRTVHTVAQIRKPGWKKPGIPAASTRKGGARDCPLTEEQKASNREKSRTRVRVEHIFGTMTNDMRGISIRTIGSARAHVQIGLMNLTYNIKRAVVLIRKKHWSFDRVIAPVAS